MTQALKQYQLDAITLAVPSDYVDSTSCEFVVPGKGRESEERLLIVAGNEPARANSLEVVTEIMERARAFDPPLRQLRSEPVRVEGRDAYAWDYSIGDESEYICRRVVIDLGKRRYLSVVYTTQSGPANESERWAMIVASLRFLPASTAPKPSPPQWRRRFMPEVSADVPATLERRDVFSFQAPHVAAIKIGITMLARPQWAGTIDDDATNPSSAHRIRNRKIETKSLPDGQLQTDRYQLVGEDGQAATQEVVRATRNFTRVGVVVIEGRCDAGPQSIDGDTVAVAESIRLRAQQHV
jgi:hypothetical protein